MQVRDGQGVHEIETASQYPTVEEVLNDLDINRIVCECGARLDADAPDHKPGCLIRYAQNLAKKPRF